MSAGTFPCPLCGMPEPILRGIERMGEARDSLLAAGANLVSKAEMIAEAERLEAAWGPAAPWRERALRAEALVAAKDEAIGELLGQLDHANHLAIRWMHFFDDVAAIFRGRQ